jgi:hypothetical protein
VLEDETWDRVPRQLDELSAETGYTLIAMEGQRPMSFSDGREHVQYLATQGYFVEVLPARRSKMILVKVWEYGDVEPSWDDVEGGVGPVLVFSFDTSAELQVYCESIVDELVRRHQYNDVYAA